ncbi:hypothetical protein E4U21_003400, partial [Claviceps maximensis]
MRRLRLLYTVTLLLIGFRTAAADAADLAQELLHATWPAARYSWIVPETTLPDAESAQVRLAAGSAPGTFCRGRAWPPGADRVLFPVEGGRLEFAVGGGNGSIADWDWDVDVWFDGWARSGWSGVQKEKLFVVVRADSDWRWNGGRRSDDSVCSAGLRLVYEVQAVADGKRRAYRVPRERLFGAEATLAVEVVRRFRRRAGSAPSDDGTDVASVLRQ